MSKLKPLYDMGTNKQSHGDREEETLYQLGLKSWFGAGRRRERESGWINL